MKHFQNTLPSALLFSYAIYSAFIQISIAHSIILFSLAGLFAYSTYLQRQETTSKINEDLRQLKLDMDGELKSQRELYERRLSKAEDEISKLGLSMVPQKVSSSSSNNKPKMMF